MISEFSDASESLTIETPSGLPDTLRHALNVLGVLGVRDDAMFLALLGECVSADPIHLCRMAKDGVFNQLDGILTDRIAFSGTDLHIPFTSNQGAPLPEVEIIINLATNSTSAWFYAEKAEQYVSVAPEPVGPDEMLEQVNRRADEGGKAERLAALNAVFCVLRDTALLCYDNQSPLETQRIEPVFE